MTMLVLGVLLWSGVHFFPVFSPNGRAKVISRFGENGYAATFSVLLLGALALMIFGWRSAGVGENLFDEEWARYITHGLMFLALLLFVSAKAPCRIRRIIRHPQLTAVLFWSAGHLLINNDMRSLILFGGMLLWSVISILGINHRDGAYTPPDAKGVVMEIQLVLSGAVFYFALAYFHDYFTGLPLQLTLW